MRRFRLETVLRVRRSREEVAAVELAHAQALRKRQGQVLAGLEAERHRVRESVGRLEREGLLARDLLLHRDWEQALRRRWERERLVLREHEAACEVRRLSLLERSREKQVMERLKERQMRLARLAEARAETKLLDEVGGRLRAPHRQEGGA
jgi:flagellar FliJ protein